MYSQQKGCLPALTSSIAVILFLYIWVGSIFSIYFYWLDIRSVLPPAEITAKILYVTVNYLILMVIFIIISLILGGMFPDIRVTEKGIKYRFLSFFHGRINWNEIEEIIDLRWPPNYKAIIISRKGFFFINGLWLNRLYGLLTGCGEPVLLISPKIKDRAKILEYINLHIEFKSI